MADKIIPMLWFDTQAEEAARFYCSIFKKSKLGKIARYPEGGPGVPGSVMTVEFKLEGQDYVALNGGPHFKFTEAVSLTVNCKDQKEIDYYWDKLLEGGGKPSQCGWLKDKFGLSWQVVPVVLQEMLHDADKKKANRVMNVMLQMHKLDIAKLQEAYNG